MDKQLDVLQCHPDGGVLLGASCLTGRYWLGSLWYYQNPKEAPDVERCTAGVQLEAGVADAQWLDNTHVLVGLDTGGLAVWALEDDNKTFTLAQSNLGHDSVLSSLSITSDKTKAASAGFDKCIKLWDLPTVSLLYNAQAHLDSILSIDCHPSEPDLFVTCGQDDRILLWDKRKPKPACLLSRSPLPHSATCVRWQPGQVHKIALGSESGHLAVLDTRAGVEACSPTRPHDRPVYRMAFSPNQPSLLASVGEDCRTVITSLQDDSLKQLYTDQTHTDFVHGLAWSSASELLTCAWDGTVISHDVIKGVATPFGQTTRSSVKLNRDVIQNGVNVKGSISDLKDKVKINGVNGDLDGGAGDGLARSDDSKVSYSKAVKDVKMES